MGGARGVGVAAAATSDPYGSSFASGGVLRRVEGAQGRRGGVQSGDVALGGRLGRGHGTVWCTGCAPRMRLHVYRTYMRMCTCMSIAHIVAYAHGTWAGVCTRFARTPAPLTRTHTHSAQPGVRALRLTAPMPSHARVSAPLRRRCAATAGRKERSRRCGARSRTPRAGRSC